MESGFIKGQIFERFKKKKIFGGEEDIKDNPREKLKLIEKYHCGDRITHV
jgi:hypothetical protein